MPPERQLWLTFLFLALLASAARPAAAQDTLGEPRACDAFSWPRRAWSLAPESWSAVWELGPYLRSAEGSGAALSSRSFLKKAPSTGPSRLVVFTRLAGMFMGRVSPWSMGGMRICFKLDIQ